MSYHLGAELLNFGALHRIHGRERGGVRSLLPAQREQHARQFAAAAGRVRDLPALWINLRTLAIIAGGCGCWPGCSTRPSKTKRLPHPLVLSEPPE